MNGWRSPRLGIQFELAAEGLSLRYPDGRPFLEVWELFQAVEGERSRAEVETKRAERLAARLRALGIDPDKEADPGT
ncbi:MAG: hypothetical protein FJ398_16640 [Verrucomicrobia bacterium]|nr:hypothetical protein [Verrucomicrobiota bacterium]